MMGRVASLLGVGVLGAVWFLSGYVTPLHGQGPRTWAAPEMPTWFWGLVAVCVGMGLWCKYASTSKRPEGRCVQCCYDLSENTSGRCPECGRAVEVESGPANE